MTNKYIKRASASLIIEEVQIKTIIGFWIIIYWIIKLLDNNLDTFSSYIGTNEKFWSSLLLEGGKLVQTLWRAILALPIMIKIPFHLVSSTTWNLLNEYTLQNLCIKMFIEVLFVILEISGTSLVAQWLRIRLPMQGTQVRALVREDPTCHGALSPCATTTEAML